jgi:hypothetical protein
MTKQPGARMVVITTAGNPRHLAHGILEHARRSGMWRVSETPGPPPWTERARLDEQRARLPAAVFEQLYENVWTEPEGDFLDPAVVDAAFLLPGPELRADPTHSHGYVAGLDLGAVHDASVFALGHREDGRTHLDLMRVWQGRRGARVDFAEVGRFVLDLWHEFHFTLNADPWQGEELIGRLREEGVEVSRFHFGPQSKMRLASTLLHALNTGSLALYPADGLRDELVALRVVQKDAGLFAFDHAPGEHDDRAVALALMLVEAIERGEAATLEVFSYIDDPTVSTVIRRGDVILTGAHHLDDTGELGADGEPIRMPPPHWQTIYEHEPW